VRPLVPARLHQTIEHLAFCVDGPPQIHFLAANGDEHLIKVPGRMRFGAHRSQTPGDHGAEHRHSDRFVGDVDTAFGKQFFDVSEAQREAKIEPDGVLDDFRRETIAGRRTEVSYARLRPPRSGSNG
jgi:hypothetical protein